MKQMLYYNIVEIFKTVILYEFVYGIPNLNSAKEPNTFWKLNEI